MLVVYPTIKPIETSEKTKKNKKDKSKKRPLETSTKKDKKRAKKSHKRQDETKSLPGRDETGDLTEEEDTTLMKFVDMELEARQETTFQILNDDIPFAVQQ